MIQSREEGSGSVVADTGAFASRDETPYAYITEAQPDVTPASTIPDLEMRTPASTQADMFSPKSPNATTLSEIQTPNLMDENSNGSRSE